MFAHESMLWTFPWLQESTCIQTLNKKTEQKKKKKTAGARRQGIDVGSCVEENDVNETVAVGTLLI